MSERCRCGDWSDPAVFGACPVCSPKTPAAIPQPVERPYEQTLDESERRGD